MISLRLRNWALYDWCAIILPLVNDPNGVSADDFGIQNPYIHIAFLWQFHWKNAMWLYTPIHHLSKKARFKLYCHEFEKSNFRSKISDHVPLGQVTVRYRFFSKFMAIQFQPNQIKMTLTENQFLIFFSFSPKLIPFLSSLISNSFFHWLGTLILYFFAKFTILVKSYYYFLFSGYFYISELC